MNIEPKLLVIDDDQFDRLHFRRALKESGLAFELAETETAANAFDLILTSSFDCIFLDYLLPGDNGLDFLKRIREKGVKTPVVIITSQGNESIAVELMKAGASDYIVKNDINGLFLTQVLRNVLRISKMVQEREEAQQALKISESRLAEAQRIAKLGNWELDMHNESLHWSAEVYHIFGLDSATFTPTMENVLEYVTPEHRNVAYASLDQAFHQGSFNIDITITTHMGIKYINVQGYPIKYMNGQTEKVIGTLQDITERKLSEQEILKARELAENSMKVKEIFLANMSHEIRTPLNAILGFTRLLGETELSSEQEGYIEAIQFSGENLLVIINDILDLSKLQSGKMVMEKCEFNFHELVTGVISLLRPKATEKGLQLMCRIEPEVPAHLKGDPVRINQILTNLISNAVKFTGKGGVYLNIRSTATEEVNLIEIEVRDTGIGIPKDKQGAIFENFVQASSETTRKYGGSGLGLTIVKNLVELLEGTIALNSAPGYGSTFTVHLPLEKADDNVHVQTPSVHETESTNILMGASILVVEDNNVNQLLIKKVLDKVHCRTDIASNGLEAIEYIKSKKYDVILMDVQMPEMDGIEATRYIRSKLTTPFSSIPIIAMTAHAFGSDVNKCISAGMNDYLSKPFKPEVLYSKIAKHMNSDSNTRVIPIHESSSSSKCKIDLTPIYELGSGDTAFLNDLVLVYDKQTPSFVEKLRGYLKSHNFEAIRSICHQIKSSYGILGLSELDDVLQEVLAMLGKEKPKEEIGEITRVVNIVISLISAINEEVQRSLRKTG